MKNNEFLDGFDFEDDVVETQAKPFLDPKESFNKIKAMFCSDLELELAVKMNKDMRYENAIKELQGIAYATTYDNILSDSEIKMIAGWLLKNEEFLNSWPIMEVYEKFMIPVTTGKVTDEWKNETLELLKSIAAGKKVVDDIFDKIDSPEKLKNKNIMLTGNFENGLKRSEVYKLIEKNGGVPHKVKHLSSNTEILIVGEKGSDAWRFGNYGRKIEDAIEMRKNYGYPKIIKESDFIELLEE